MYKVGERVDYKQISESMKDKTPFRGWYDGVITGVYQHFITLSIKPKPEELIGIGNAWNSKAYKVSVTYQDIKRGITIIRRKEHEGTSRMD